MTILTSIEEIVKDYFGDLFENTEEFYLKNFLVLIQGILSKKHGSVSGIAMDPLNKVAHTTLTRFLREHTPFWYEIQKRVREILKLKTETKRIIIIDDTLVERRGKQIPYTSKQFDHCQSRYTHGQVVLTIGEIMDSLFQPLEMMFTGSAKETPHTTKNELVVAWMKANTIKDVVIVADSWYTNSYLIETCHYQHNSTFIGRLKSNLLLREQDSKEAFFKTSKLIHSSKMNRKTIIRGKVIKYRSWLVHLKSVRIPLKIVITELKDGSRAALVSSNITLSSEEIISYYALRWSIESFFKLVKQNFSFSKCQIRSKDAQNNFMLLVSIVYLIFKDLKSLVSKVQKNCSNPVLFAALDAALSTSFVIKPMVALFDFSFLDIVLSFCPSYIQPLLHPLLLGRTS
jgi:IS4 transposase